MMMLRNVELTESKCKEIKKKLLSDQTITSLTFYNVRGSLNCDFLLNNDNDEDDEFDVDNDNCYDDCDSNITQEVREEATSTATATGIEELTIERCHLDTKGCQALGRVLRNCSSSTLKLFKLKNVHIPDTDSCLIPLIEGINAAGINGGCLKSINFERVVIGSGGSNKKNGLCRFFAAIGNCTNLRHLRLVDCSLQSNDDISELATQTIQKLLQNNNSGNNSGNSKQFESLDLSRNNIDGSGVDLLLRMGFQQQQQGNNNNNNNSFKRLVLSHNPVGDDGAIHISRFFSSHYSNTKTTKTRIEALSLVDCDIWSEGCEAISNELKYFDTLQELHIIDGHNDDDDDDGGEWEHHLPTILESIKSTNVVLQHFYTSNNSVSQQHHYHHQINDNDNNGTVIEQQWKEIDYYLQLNRAKLRRLSKEPNVYPFALYPVVVVEDTKMKNNSKDRAATTERKNNNNTSTTTAAVTTATTINADVWFDLLRRRPELVSFATSASHTSIE